MRLPTLKREHNCMNNQKSKGAVLKNNSPEVIKNATTTGMAKNAIKIKVLKIKRQQNIVNASYLFTQISYLEKTYTTTARELSIHTYIPKYVLNIGERTNAKVPELIQLPRLPRKM